MARASDQFRASDVTFWGIAALVCGGIAVLSANVSALIPESVLAGLHATRLGGATINQLRDQVANLQLEAAQMRRENGLLLSRFAMAERAAGEVVRRVGALEVSLPLLLEAIPREAELDRTTITSGIGDEPAQTFDTEGGSVSVEQKPLGTMGADEDQPMPGLAIVVPEVAVADASAFAIALGPVVGADQAGAVWADLTGKVGTLLLGLGPLLADDPEGGKRIVAGPLVGASQASELCDRISAAGIACRTALFIGEPLLP